MSVSDDKAYSRAFDNIVQGSDDTVGLLAYALFKQGIRENAAEGRREDATSRNPPATVVRVYRDAAQRILEEFASNAIAEATPEVQQSAILAAVVTAEGSVKAHIDQKTNWKNAILTNLVAWVITIFVTVMVLTAYALPNIQQDMLNTLREVGRMQPSPPTVP